MFLSSVLLCYAHHHNSSDLTESLIKASKQHMDKQLSSSRGGSHLPLGPSLVSLLLGPAAAGAAGAAATPGTPTANQYALVPAAGGGGVAGAAAGGAATAGQAGQVGQLLQQQQGAAQQDDLSSLLEALAAVFRVRPGLWYDGEAPEAYPHVSSFMSYVSMQLLACWWGVVGTAAPGQSCHCSTMSVQIQQRSG